MQVVLLGTGAALPVASRGYAGIYVKVANEHVVLDAGPGTMQRLARVGVTHLNLDRVFLTHFHPDHCLDVVSILFAMRIPQPARTKPLVIYGPRGLKRLYHQLNTAFHGWIAPRTYRLTFKELGETTMRLHGYTVQTKRMNHANGFALGYRLTEGRRSLAYSGDTDYCEEIVALGRRAHLLILECSMTDERKVAGHLTPSECGRIAAQAGCRHLVLTHFYPVFAGYDLRRRIRRVFRGRLALARDFATFLLS